MKECLIKEKENADEMYQHLCLRPLQYQRKASAHLPLIPHTYTPWLQKKKNKRIK